VERDGRQRSTAVKGESLSLERDLVAGFGSALGAPADDALGTYIRQGSGLPGGGARLLAWDANSIHAFVFDTQNATGIRGASDMLRGIDEDLHQGRHLGLAPGQVLFAGGGSGVAVVASRDVEECKRRLHRLFAQETRIATCTAADVDLGEGEEGFDSRVRALGRELARQRLLIGPDAEPSVPFFLARCQVCGRRAAALEKRRGEEGGTRLECQPCHDRIQRGKGKIRRENEPTGFEDIADAQGKGFYAVVYLDGNGIGRTITGLKSPLDYASFSEAIDRVLRGSFETLTKRYELGELAEEREGKGRYQLPICGGDDVVAILPGEVAVPFTRDLLTLLEDAADGEPALGASRIGASAGIAIGKVSFPVRHLLAEAEALLTTAKRRVYDDPLVRSALSFAVVTDGSPRSESVEPERWKRAPEELLLSGRPYSLRELATFSRRFRRVKKAGKVGRTQLYALHSHAILGPRQFRNHVLYQIGRREEWQDLVVDLAEAGDRKALLGDPSRCAEQFAPDYSGRRVFDVADMVDLLRHWREPEEVAAP
jgi:hypothetical protein